MRPPRPFSRPPPHHTLPADSRPPIPVRPDEPSSAFICSQPPSVVWAVAASLAENKLNVAVAGVMVTAHHPSHASVAGVGAEVS